MRSDVQFEIYRQALARLEKRNQLIVRELRLGHYQTALEYATTPADSIISQLDWHNVSNNVKVYRSSQVELFGGDLCKTR